MEFLFNYCPLLIYILVFVTVYKVQCIPFYPTLLHIQSLETERKEKKNKRK